MRDAARFAEDARRCRHRRGWRTWKGYEEDGFAPSGAVICTNFGAVLFLRGRVPSFGQFFGPKSDFLPIRVLPGPAEIDEVPVKFHGCSARKSERHTMTMCLVMGECIVIPFVRGHVSIAARFGVLRKRRTFAKTA